MCRVRVVAFDMRHHGETALDDSDADYDFSRDTLKADIFALWQHMFGEEQPPTVLVGHSVGGAVAVWAAAEEVAEGEGITTLEGLIVIDVVEGTALGVLRDPWSQCYFTLVHQKDCVCFCDCSAAFMVSIYAVPLQEASQPGVMVLRAHVLQAHGN